MKNLFKQLLTSRLYWSFHDFTLKFWWVGAIFITSFWVLFFSLQQNQSENNEANSSWFDSLFAAEEVVEVIDWNAWESEMHAFEASLENQTPVEKQNMEKQKLSDIEQALVDLKRHYPSRNYVYWKTITSKVTFYTPDERSCGPYSDGKTSKMDNAYRFDGVATSPDVIPYRCGVFIPGVGIKEVDDTGGAMRQAAKKGFYHIDVRVRSNKTAMNWGVRWKRVHLFKMKSK